MSPSTEPRAREIARQIIAERADFGWSCEEFSDLLGSLVTQSGVNLDEIRAADLLLARGCARGSAAALKEFWTTLVPQMRSAALSVTGNVQAAEDVVQEVLTELLVGRDERGPSIATYQGRSKLQRWLRSVTVRAALKARPKVQSEDSVELPELSDDPELALLKEQAGSAVETALLDALRELSPEDRLVLQQHLVDGLSIDQLATIYRIHRATAARRIAKAREDLLDLTRSKLRAVLQLDGRDLESLINFAQSRIKLSVRWLGASPEPEVALAD